jgi:hypothetical protein
VYVRAEANAYCVAEQLWWNEVPRGSKRNEIDVTVGTLHPLALCMLCCSGSDATARSLRSFIPPAVCTVHASARALPGGRQIHLGKVSFFLALTSPRPLKTVCRCAIDSMSYRVTC